MNLLQLLPLDCIPRIFNDSLRGIHLRQWSNSIRSNSPSTVVNIWTIPASKTSCLRASPWQKYRSIYIYSGNYSYWGIFLLDAHVVLTAWWARSARKDIYFQMNSSSVHFRIQTQQKLHLTSYLTYWVLKLQQ